MRPSQRCLAHKLNDMRRLLEPRFLRPVVGNTVFLDLLHNVVRFGGVIALVVLVRHVSQVDGHRDDYKREPKHGAPHDIVDAIQLGGYWIATK